MCNIAGYVGERAAAPILIDMMLREEGFAGGYFTGIATIHEGKLYYAKLTGDTKRLLDLTEAASLPGNIGIIHSRSKEVGDDEWAHPFVGEKNGEPVIAYVANGAKGYFAPRAAEFNLLAERLLAKGFTMHSRAKMAENKYHNFSDGTSVHMSDVMCQLIHRNILRGDDEVKAMTEAFCEMPGEIVGLLLSLATPDKIFWSRINMPMSVGFSSHGAYMASAAIAFPEDAGEPIPLPVNASGYVTRNGYTVNAYEKAPVEIAPITAKVRKEAYDLICKMISEEEQTIPVLAKSVKPLFGDYNAFPAALLVYDILYSLNKQGKLKTEIYRVDGVVDGIDAPEARFSLI